jgi:hypothetical protein
MNWKRIVIFFFILWAVSYAVGFTFGFLTGFLGSLKFTSLDWIPYLQSISMIAALSYVFTRLFRLQTERGFQHAYVVAILTWVSSFPINVVYAGQPISQWFLGGLILFAICIPVGAKIARITGKGSQNAGGGTNQPPKEDR